MGIEMDRLGRALNTSTDVIREQRIDSFFVMINVVRCGVRNVTINNSGVANLGDAK